MSAKPNSNVYSDFYEGESNLSHEIKILAEVEKIWILYDLDQNESLDFEEV